MNQAAFGIKHKVTGLFFAGFGPAPEYKVLWVAQAHEAKAMSQNDARGQALLFASHDIPVQKKPVAI